jgi:very-short-patch-repair endonuclease
MNQCKCGCGLLVEYNYKRGHGRRNRINSNEHNIAISLANKGRKRGTCWNKGLKGVYSHTDEIKQKIRDIAKSKGFGIWMKGKIRSKESIEKQRQSNNGHITSIETRKKIGKANSGSNNGMWKKEVSKETRLKLSELSRKMWQNPLIRSRLVSKFNTPEAKLRSRQSALKAAKSLKSKWFHNTAPEMQMKGILEKLSIKYIHTYPVWDIEHCYCADFFLDGKIILEVDGKYWHNYPYGTDKDRIRVEEMEKQGYTVLRFWEEEFDLESVKIKLEGLNVFITK